MPGEHQLGAEQHARAIGLRPGGGLANALQVGLRVAQDRVQRCDGHLDVLHPICLLVCIPVCVQHATLVGDGARAVAGAQDGPPTREMRAGCGEKTIKPV